MAEPKGSVLPIYFVADESGSMEKNVDELNKGLVSLLDALQSETMAASMIRFCVVGFADTANCYLEPSDLRNIENMPKFSTHGTTSYTSAFEELHRRIPLDIGNLKNEGYIVNRPAVFFLTDGVPNTDDNWEVPFESLTALDFGPRPNILAFGIGDADANVIRKIATKEEYAFIAAHGTDTGRAVADFCKALVQSVIGSGQALAGGQAALPIEKPAGFISLAIDPVDTV